MSEQQPNAANAGEDQPVTASPDTSPQTVPTETPAGEPAPGDTVGTGSVIALGCIGGTLFLIVLGLIYIVLVQIFG